MRMYDIIEKKRDGFALTTEEINFVVDGYTNGEIPDYQVSALLMAIYFQGMDLEECASLTMAMVHSGQTVDLSGIEGMIVDKHSTGGVGDSISLIIGPLVASAGVPVAKMSGRGLGHTGGTLDKLEAIPGFQIGIPNEKFIQLVNENGLAIIGQTGELVPADRLLYSLRDVTATVNSIPLIASSIMSKKIASGAQAIVLDVKTGAGAFMKTTEEAKELAETMVAIGKRVGRQTVAVISNMNEPLGHAVGNALEVQEAIDVLRGEGPEDLTELSIELGAHMLVLAERTETLKEAKAVMRANLHEHKALEKFQQFVAAQEGDGRVAKNPDLLTVAANQTTIRAAKSGYVTKLSAEKIGTAAMLLGAGRQTKNAEIDLSVGVYIHHKTGTFVEEGDPVFTMYAKDSRTEAARKLLEHSLSIEQDVNMEELILDVIT